MASCVDFELQICQNHNFAEILISVSLAKEFRYIDLFG